MTDKSYKYLRIYPGLRTNNEIKFKNISFQSIEDSKLEKIHKDFIKQSLNEFLIEDIDNHGAGITLAEMPLLMTSIEARDLYSFEKILNPYEQVLFFMANLELPNPPIYENISFRILENDTPHIIYDLRSLRIDPYWPKNIYISQYQFVEKDNSLQSKLLKIFTNMKNEVYQPNSNQNNQQLGNQNLVASLYWYNKGCMMSEHLEEKSAIIYFATAFEAFYNIVNRFKKESLGYAVQRYLGDNSRLRKWINDFYEARNIIVHGSYIGRDELKAVKGTNYVHSIVAKRVFQECLLRQLHITEGLDYVRTDMNISYEYIVNDLLTLNEDKFNKLKNRTIFSYESISSDENVAKDFFKTLKSINVLEHVESGKSESSSKNYAQFTSNLAGIVVDWINDAIKKDKFPPIRLSIHADALGIDDEYYPNELQKITSYFEGFEPNDAKEIFDTWDLALDNFNKLYQRYHPSFLSPYKRLGLFDILDFVVKTSIRLG